MILDEPRIFISHGRVIWQPTAADLECGTKESVICPSVTVKMNSAQRQGKLKEV